MKCLQPWVWLLFYLLICVVAVFLFYKRKQSHLRGYDQQDIGRLSDPLLELFKKEMVAYLIRMGISFVFGMFGALCNQADGFIAAAVLTGILIGTAMERVLRY